MIFSPKDLGGLAGRGNGTGPRRYDGRLVDRLVQGWRPRSTMCLLLLVAVNFLAGGGVGCSTASRVIVGDLTLTSRDSPQLPKINLGDRVDRALYRVDDRNTLTVLLIEGTIERPRRIATVSMFWDARAGRTPVDRTATNATVHLLDFVMPEDVAETGGFGAEAATQEIRLAQQDPGATEFRDGSDTRLGIYAGGGFIRLYDDPRDGRLEASLQDFDLRLTDRSADYADRLGRAVLAGRLVAERDDAAVVGLLRRVNQQVAAALGYPRLVRVDPAGEASPGG